MNKNEIVYFQKLPHYHPIGATFFVIFMIYNAIHKRKMIRLKEQYDIDNIHLSQMKCYSDKIKEQKVLQLKYYNDFDELLHSATGRDHFLRIEELAEIVKFQIHRFDGKLYNLICYTIMSNHVHLLISTDLTINNSFKLKNISGSILSYSLQRIKGASARYANRFLSRSGRFWQKESHDMYIRNTSMLNNVINYILNNPVKAGYVKKPKDFKHNYFVEWDESKNL